MVRNALLEIRESLNEFLINRYDIDSDVVEINRLVGSAGDQPSKNQNKVIITLINLAQETASQYYSIPTPDRNGGYRKINPDMCFNLEILFTCCFDDYDESLKFLGSLLSFFQSHLVLREFIGKESNSAGVLKFELQDQTFSEMHSLWNSMGAKYSPSVVCRVKHIIVQENQTTIESASVSDINVRAEPL